MDSKTKTPDRLFVPFLGTLTEEQIKEGMARFLAEINSKAIRLQATKPKKNNHH